LDPLEGQSHEHVCWEKCSPQETAGFWLALALVMTCLRWEMDGGKSNQQLEEPLSGEQGEMGRWLGEASRWLSDPWP